MKHIDVRIECSDQFQVFVHDVLLAVEKEYPVTAQITVTELPPQVEERSCENCKDKQTSAESLPCLTCMRAFHGHYSHCKLSNNFDNWQPAIPVSPPQKEKKNVCEDCAGTGWVGDNGPGIAGNSEFVRCDCGTIEKCSFGCHPYRLVNGVPWCDKCKRQADLTISRISHMQPHPPPQVGEEKKYTVEDIAGIKKGNHE